MLLRSRPIAPDYEIRLQVILVKEPIIKNNPGRSSILSTGLLFLVAIALGLLAGWFFSDRESGFHQLLPQEHIGPSPVEAIPKDELKTEDLILLGARQEAKQRIRYDASYASIDYPGGDVAPDRGACTDVVIRAFRNAGIDLQQLIHEDMKADFASYPSKWGLNSPDSNIDHRRVPNQIQYFKTHGKSLTLEVEGHLEEWKWGDVVYWRFPDGRDHCGIISDRTT
ncbi:MAG: DUF1287 domain-containing protein, partial [Syntrophomonadaceae bacterium]|nr:DUF1287 domain-containing protein [Syntrophomonadaceae bacterium]